MLDAGKRGDEEGEERRFIIMGCSTNLLNKICHTDTFGTITKQRMYIHFRENSNTLLESIMDRGYSGVTCSEKKESRKED